MRFNVVEGSASYEVDTDRHCNCGSNLCKHLYYAKLVNNGPNTHLLFLLLSAMHKEVRRSDVLRATHYGWLIASLFSDAVVERYIRSICLEETRSLGLFKFVSQAPWRRSLPALVASQKKWARIGPSQILRKAKAYFASNACDLGGVLNPLDSECFEAGIQRLLFIRKLKDKKKILRDMARYNHCIRPSPASKTFKETNEYNWRFYQWIFLLEEKFGVPETSFQTCVTDTLPNNSDDTLFFPEPYVFDLHTREGKRILHKHWRSIEPGKKLPAGLDHRFGGCILSAAWRELAFERAGDEFRHLPWEAVTFSAEDWALLKFFDAYFYPDFYSRVEPDVLAVRRD